MFRLFSLLAVMTALIISVSAVSTTGAPQQTSEGPSVATGVVFHDENQNEQYDSGEIPLEGIRVSNGKEIVATDSEGRYEIDIDDDTTLFVIKPRNFRTPLNEENLPVFYYHHKPHGSPRSRFAGVQPTGPLPDSVDFPLYPQEEPETFQAILFGDPQPRNQTEVDYIAHDVIEELIGTEASFGVTLGDIVFDDLDIMPSINKTIALLGIPWYNVVGNHDINQDAPSRKYVNETFEKIYGPSYYSFDYGAVHFIVIDNIEWVVPQNGGRSTYRGGLGEDQLEFIKTDLEQIPEEQMVVLLMHIPIVGVHDRHGLYRLIENRPLCISISGHTHTHEHIWISKDNGWNGPKPHHHIVNVTVSGSWWGGAHDERGIPHATMSDGAPNGYSILNFDGNEYRLDFHAAGRGADYQMEINSPEVVAVSEAGRTPVTVNFFNGDQNSKVEMRLGDGTWIEMKKVLEPDPKYARTFERDMAIRAKDESVFTKLPSPGRSSHLWKAMLPGDVNPGTYRIDVRATDRHGRVFEDHRIIRVTK